MQLQEHWDVFKDQQSPSPAVYPCVYLLILLHERRPGGCGLWVLGACQVRTSARHNFDIGEWVLKRWASHSPVKGWPLLLCPGVSGEAAPGWVPSPHQHPGSLLRCRNMRCAWAQHTLLGCADGQDVHLAQTAVAHEGLRHISSPLTVLLFRLDAKEAKYHQG